MAESKIRVNPHSRRTKSGQVRVKEGRRNNKTSLAKKALGAAVGAGTVYGLLKGKKKLGEAITKQRNLRDFKPKAEGTLFPGYDDAYPLTSKSIKIGSQQALSNAKSKKPQVTVTTVGDVDKIKSNLKKGNNASKVLARRKLLDQVEVAADDTNVWPIKPLQEASRVNKNRKQRKQAGKRLSDAAKDLRSRGFYQ